LKGQEKKKRGQSRFQDQENYTNTHPLGRGTKTLVGDERIGGRWLFGWLPHTIWADAPESKLGSMDR